MNSHITISGHEFELIDELYTWDEEGQCFTTSCLSSGQNIPAGKQKCKYSHSDMFPISSQCWFTSELLPRSHETQSNTSVAGTYLPSSRGRILLCWISVMCSKPISFTPFNVFSLTKPAREAKDVSSNAPEMSEQVTSHSVLSHTHSGQVEMKHETNCVPKGRDNRSTSSVSLQSVLSGE